MKLITVSVLLQLVITVGCTSSLCPPGFIENTTSNFSDNSSCVCSQNLNGIIDCNEGTGIARLAIGFCMTHDMDTNSTIVGRCPYNSNYTVTEHGTVSLYETLPDDVFELKQFICGQYNRKHLLCHTCEHGFRSSMTSYSMECIPCESKYKNLGRFTYIAMRAFLATIVYVLIMAFDIRLTKSPWNIFILFSQIIVNMLNYDRHLYSGLLYATGGNAVTPVLTKIVLALYGFWNLDFLPNILPAFCFDIPKRGRHELLYEYFVALYPLGLVHFIYLCVHLNSRDFKLIVWLWKGIKYCLDSQACCGLKRVLLRISSQSIAHSLSSYLVLGYPKILFVSLDILLPVQLYDLHGKPINNSISSYYDTDLPYFSGCYLPYVVIAFIMVTVFTILPALFYTFCLTFCCKVPLSWRLFVESFHGWFKDSIKGTRDYRVLAGLHPLLRILLALSIALNIVFVRPHSLLANAQWLIPGVVFMLCSMLFTWAQPYKQQYMNQIESLLFGLLGFISLLVSTSSYTGLYIAIIMGAFPMLLFTGYMMHLMIKQVKKLYFKCTQSTNSVIDDSTSLLASMNENFNADRLENPTEYPTNCHSLQNHTTVNICADTSPVNTYGTF